ncbi:hypothetical protein GC173_09820 [bacterium]|nr:hypothetical protein [bacterium]
MRRISLQTTTLLLVSTGMIVSCTGRSPRLPDQVRGPETTPAIWTVTDTPSPLPLVKLVPGEQRRVSLLGSSSLPLFTIQEAGAENPIGVSIVIEEDALVVRAEPGSDGATLVKANLISPRGSVDAVYFPVVVEPLPIVTFRYTKPAKPDTKVFAAGSFNGWNNSADQLVRQADGSYLLEKAIPPGVHTYKLVVDGEWIADPSNPEMESGGYGNSLLRVGGESKKTLNFSVLSAAMPGSGPQGGFGAALEKGTAIDPASVTLIVNNKRRRVTDWIIDHPTGTIRLALPEADWLKENNVILLANTTDGRAGQAVSRFSYAGAPRSPRDEVLYFPMTDRFLDGDPSNNPVQDNTGVHPLAQYKGGDWAGIRQKIEDGYFTSLGITTIWISPPNLNTFKIEKESIEPGRLFSSYHGYWPVATDKTNPAFGSMEELKALVDAAHAKGIAVLLDFVSNHVHEDHPLYQADPTIATPLKLSDGKNNIREFDAHPFTTWFDTFLPTLDYDKRPDLIATMTDSAVFWMRESGADGFRHDAVKHVPLPLWRELTKKLRREFSVGENRAVFQIGETISGHSTVSAFVGPDLLDGQFDFPNYFAVQGTLARGTGKMSDLAEAIRGAQRYYPPSAIMSPLLGNHDVGRFMAYADGDFPQGMKETEVGYTMPPQVDQPLSYKKLQLGFAYLTSLEGPPTIYYGDEIGMTGAQDPDNRRPMQWEDWTPDQVATRDTVSKLNALRHQSVALRRGVTEILKADDETLVLARIAPEEVIIAAFARNNKAGDIAVTIPTHWGTPHLSPTLAGTMTSEMEGGQFTLVGGDYSYGFWRVEW